MMQLNNIQNNQPISSPKTILKTQYSDKTYSNRILNKLQKRKSPFPNSEVVSKISNFIYSSLLNNLFDPTNKLSEDFLKEINSLELNYPFFNVGKIIEDYLKTIVTEMIGKKIQLKDNDDLNKIKKEDINKIINMIKKEKKHKEPFKDLLLNVLSPKLDTFIKQFQKKDVKVDSTKYIYVSDQKNNFQEKYEKWKKDIFKSGLLPDFNFQNEIKLILFRVEQDFTKLNDNQVENPILKADKLNEYDKKIENFKKELIRSSISYKLKKTFIKLLVQEIHNDIAKLSTIEDQKFRLLIVDELKLFKELYLKSDEAILNLFNVAQIEIFKNYGLFWKNFQIKAKILKDSSSDLTTSSKIDLNNLVIHLNIPAPDDTSRSINVDFFQVDKNLIYSLDKIYEEIKNQGLFPHFFNSEKKIYEKDIIGKDSITSKLAGFDNLKELLDLNSNIPLTTKYKEIKRAKSDSDVYFANKLFSNFDNDKIQLLAILNKYGIKDFKLGVYLRNFNTLIKTIAIPGFDKDYNAFLDQKQEFVFTIDEIFNELNTHPIKFVEHKIIEKENKELIEKGRFPVPHWLIGKMSFAGLPTRTPDNFIKLKEKDRPVLQNWTNWKSVLEQVQKSKTLENIDWSKYEFKFLVNTIEYTLDLLLISKDSNLPAVKNNRRITINNDLIIKNGKWIKNIKDSAEKFKKGFGRFKLKKSPNKLAKLLEELNLQMIDYLKSDNLESESDFSQDFWDPSPLYEGLVPTSSLYGTFENFMQETLKKFPTKVSIVILGDSSKQNILNQKRHLKFSWVFKPYFLDPWKAMTSGNMSKYQALSPINMYVPLVLPKEPTVLNNKNLNIRRKKLAGKINTFLKTIEKNPKMYQKLQSHLPKLKSKLDKIKNIFKLFSQDKDANIESWITENQFKQLEKLLQLNLDKIQKEFPQLFLGSKILSNLTKAFKGKISKDIWKFIEKYPNIVRELANSQLDYSTIAKMLRSKKIRKHLTSFTNWKGILPKAEMIAKNYKYAFLASATGLGVAGITSSVVSLSGALKRITKNKSGIYFSRFVVSITAIVGVTLICISSALFIFSF